MKKILYTFITLLLASSFSLAQNSTYEWRPGYWTLGLNGGLSYQSSDVPILLEGYGGGLTLAKNLYYRPNAPFAFDLRGRFLYSQSYGLDTQPTFDIDNNEALNGQGKLDYLNYPEDSNISDGFVYQNHKTDMAELGLEGVLTFNQLRERHGVLLQLYGGLGLDWYKTRIDQTDRSGQPYYNDYASLNPDDRKSELRRSLRDQILDGEYETLADEFGERGKIGIMPAIGFELGYHFSKNFYASLGHKVTFAGTDLLDGEQWADPNNDIHHYTSLGLNWIIEPARERTQQAVPEITMIQPRSTAFSSRSPNSFLRAEIEHVNSAADVNCTVNGRATNFSFTGNDFSVDVPLRPGRNEVLITATNPAGKAQKQIVIVYEQEEEVTPPPVTTPPPVVTPPNNMPAPTVRFTNPSANRFETEAQRITVRATARNTPQSGIRFSVNGRTVRSFSYDARSGNFSADVNLREGRNVLEITATNESGRQRDELTIMRQIERIPLPTVRITSPGNRISTQRPQATVLARTEYVFDQNDIEVEVNGRRMYNFFFDENRQALEADVNLRDGYNTVTVRVQNESGRSQDEVSIRYEEPRPSTPGPEVRIVTPGSSRVETDRSTALIRANTAYVNSKNDVYLTVNGRRTYDFDFSRNQQRIEARVNLREGYNTINITVENETAMRQDEVSIRFQPVRPTVPAPVVRFLEPSRSGNTVEDADARIEASVQNVERKDDIQLEINGRRTNSFSFSGNRIRHDFRLQPGNNTIRITAFNESGRDEAQTSIRYEERVAQPPRVSITTPNNNSRVDEASVKLQARIYNVDNRRDVEVLVNGKAQSSFSFARSQLTATVSLREGTNTIRVQVRNADGQDEASVRVIFEKPKPVVPKPVVQIIAPARPGSTVQTARYNLKARVQHVEDKNDVTLLVNGKKLSNFTFDSRRGNVSAFIDLKNGKNNILVQARNESGSASANSSMLYEAARQRDKEVSKVQPPTVDITSASQPTINPLNPTVGSSRILATITNISSKRQITFTVNGKRITDFSFNARSGRFEARVLLEKGENKFVLRVENEAGKASDDASVSF